MPDRSHSGSARALETVGGAAPGDTTATSAFEAEVAHHCRQLIRIDTSNYGDGSGPGERAAAEYVMAELTEVGLQPVLRESAPGRSNVVVRVPGENPRRPGLVLHGHLDVVPAHAPDWQADPFSGDLRDGCIWGRGAVDMKGMLAMLLTNARHLARTGRKPPRDVVFAFFADEEAGGIYGAQWMVRKHPELFEGCSEAVSEVGGFSITLPTSEPGHTTRAYLLQSAEKGVLWLRLRARGRAGHGSMPNRESAVARLSQAITRIHAYEWPREFTVSVRDLFDGIARITGIPFDGADTEPILDQLGGARAFIEGTLSNTANATMLEAGYKHNVIPQSATATLDCRFLPDREHELLTTIEELCGEYVDIDVVHRDVALQTPFDGELVHKMSKAIEAEDPGAHVLPYCLSGGTDNKHLSTLGITGYGFAPLRLPADLDFGGMFHGVDERVPVQALEFGTRVLRRLIAEC